MSIYLSRETLCSLPDHVSRPQYKYNDLEQGIIHIGYGNFHRASIRKQMQKSTKFDRFKKIILIIHHAIYCKGEFIS